MSLQTLVWWLIGAMTTSIAAMVSGAWSDLPVLVTAGAQLFALSLVATSWHINRPLLTLPRDRIAPEALPVAARRNARLLAFVYIWGALALVAIYRGTSLRWQHGLQYAAGMAVIGILIMMWVRRSGRPTTRLLTPGALTIIFRGAVLHVLAALGGLIFLVGSGKLASMRGDWAANQVFLAGGLAVVGLSAISLLTHLHLSRCRSAADPASPTAPPAMVQDR